MADEYLVSDPTRRELADLIRDRKNAVGSAGNPVPMRQMPAGGAAEKSEFVPTATAVATGTSHDFADCLTTDETGVHGIFGCIAGSGTDGLQYSVFVGGSGAATIYAPGGSTASIQNTNAGTGITSSQTVFAQIVNVTSAPCTFTIRATAAPFATGATVSSGRGATLVKL